MTNFSLGLFFAHWLAFLGAIRQFFWSNTPRPLLSTAFPGLIEDGSEFSPIVHVPPQIQDPPHYINSIDVTTICLVPTINVTCSIDLPEHDVPLIMAAPSHHYVFLDTPVRRLTEVPHEDALPTPPPVQAEDDDTRTNMASYGARGLSFCPVLVGIVYVHSLLHLYMLLMIPSLFNHWLEDALVYDSLNPKDLLDFSWFLHTSFWIAPWRLFRYGMRKTTACLCRRSWGVSRISAHPPVPRIVLVRIDGEAVPVNFSDEDPQANLDVGVSSTLESASPEVDHRAAAIEDGESRDLASSIAPCSDGGIAKEFEPSSMPTVSLPGGCQDGVAEARNGTSLELFTSEFGEGSQTSTCGASDQRAKCHPIFVEAEDDTPPDTFTVLASDSGDAEEGPGDFQHMALLEVINDIRQNATDSTKDGEDQDQDPTFSPCIVVDDCGPDRSVLLDTATTTSPSARSGDTPSKSAQSAIHDEVEPAVDQQMSSGTSRADEHPACPGALEIQFCNEADDSARTEQVPVDPFCTSMAQTLLDQVTQLILSAVPSEEAVEDIDIPVQWPTPPSREQPVVNLPSMIAAREDVGFIEIDLILSFAPMEEDVVTRSPVQIYCPTIPAVAINVACDSKETEEKLIPPGTKEPSWEMFEQTDTLNGIVEACRMLDIDSCEQSSHPSSSSIEDLHSICPSTVKGRVGSPRMGPEASVLDTIYLPTVLESQKGPGMEDRARITTTLSGNTSSSDEVTKLLMTRPSEKVLVLPCNGASPLPLIPEVKKPGELDDEKSSKSSTVPRDRPKLTLKPTPERTLSGSMHAPSEPSLDPQPSKRIDPGSTLHETPLLSGHPVQAANDNEAVTDKITESKSERKYDSFASVHAPTNISKVEVQSSVSQSRDGNHSDDRRTMTAAAKSEKKSKAKPCSPNWAAMPDVVDAFRVFREAPSGRNSLRRASSMAECANKAPLVGIVGRKGTATNSLNSTCATANIQSCWMNGDGLLLVRDLVPSDPADFNLRSCSNLRTPRSHGTNTIPMQHVLHPGVFEVSPHALHHSTDTIAVRRPQRMSVPCVAELEHILGSQRWTAYRRST